MPARRLSRETGSNSTHFDLGNFLAASARSESSDGDVTDSLKNRSPEPSPSDKPLTAASKLFQSESLPLSSTFDDRSGSYKPRMAACCMAVAAPRLAG